MSATDRPKYDFAVSKVPIYVQPSLTSAESQKVGATEDPNSLAAISEKTQILSMQAIADSEFDAKVPAPRREAEVLQGFSDAGRTRLALSALLMVGAVAIFRLRR
jgi:hypothetical protein